MRTISPLSRPRAGKSYARLVLVGSGPWKGASLSVKGGQPDYFAHFSASIEEGAVVGSGTKIWHHSHVREGSTIGSDCNLGFAVYVDVGAVIGDRCKIQNHVSIYAGVVLEDEVFVGPSVTFTNDLYPRATSPDWKVVPTTVMRGASLGANATIVCGVTIGRWSMIGAGSLITSDVPDHALVVGTPGRVKGWLCRCGAILARVHESLPGRCRQCSRVVEGIGR